MEIRHFAINGLKHTEFVLRALKAHPNSIGRRNCEAIINQIEQRTLSLAAKQAEVPEKDFLIKLDYRNVGKNELKTWPIHVRIASIDPIQHRKEQRGHYGDKLIRWLKKISTPVSDIKFDIPNPGFSSTWNRTAS